MHKLGFFMIAMAVVTAVTTPVVMDNAARADDITISHDQLRTGWDPDEPGLSPQTVASPAFRQLFDTPVAGQVYAQPLVVGNSVIVATEEDNVYSLNAGTGAINWKLSLGRAWPAKAKGCGDLTPYVGVTSTPVYDPASNDVYLAAVIDNGRSLYQPNVDVVAVNAQSGHRDWQARIQGAPVNDRKRRFDSLTERQRSGLLLTDGEVIVAFASYCDMQPYQGLVAAVNTATHRVSLWSDEADRGKEAGIWTSGGGLMSDGPGRIFASSGNGTAPAAGPGTRPPAHLGNAVIRLGVKPGGSLAARDFFSPANAPGLNAHDKDFGSGGPVGLPFGTAAHPHLLIAAGKDGRVFVLDRDHLGGRNARTDHPVSRNGPFGGLFGHPAAFDGGGNDKFVYYLGSHDFLRALLFNTITGKLTDAGNSPGKFGSSSGSPVVTSDGSNPASAVVWAVNRAGARSSLDAFAAIPQGGRLTPLRSLPIGTATKFADPATDQGRVYVGADGRVFGFGDPRAKSGTGPAPRAVGGAGLDAAPSSLRFGAVRVGSRVTRQLVITNRTGRKETFSGAFAPSRAFSITSLSRDTLAAGQSATVTVAYAPTAARDNSGSLTLTASAGVRVIASVQARGVAR